jgi:hypothetical protein
MGANAFSKNVRLRCVTLRFQQATLRLLQLPELFLTYHHNVVGGVERLSK